MFSIAGVVIVSGVVVVVEGICVDVVRVADVGRVIIGGVVVDVVVIIVIVRIDSC